MRKISGIWQNVWIETQGESFLGIDIKGITPVKIADIQFKLPRVKINKAVRLKVSLEQAGKIITENYLELYLFTESSKRVVTKEEINLYDPESRLIEKLSQNGVRVNQGLRKSIPLAITTVLDKEVKEYVQKGGRALILQEDTLVDIEMGLAIGEPLFFVDDPFYYLEKSLFLEIPFDNPLKWPFYKVFPNRVVANLGRINPKDILAGCYGVFIRIDVKISEGKQPEDYMKRLKRDELPAAIAKFNYGKGQIVISTFKLIESYGSKDPVASIILHNLIQYLVRGFDSQTSLPLDSKRIVERMKESTGWQPPVIRTPNLTFLDIPLRASKISFFEGIGNITNRGNVPITVKHSLKPQSHYVIYFRNGESETNLIRNANKFQHLLIWLC